MKSDIQIAQEAKMEPIVKIAEKLNLSEDDIELYGKYKCKISLDVLNNNKDKKDGKLVLSYSNKSNSSWRRKIYSYCRIRAGFSKMVKKL